MSPDQAAALLATTESVQSRSVMCGDPHIRWDEQLFEAEHPAHQYFRRPKTVNLIHALTGSREVRQTVCWTSGYKVGEYINPHRDRAGSIQLLICLKAPHTPESGGALVINGQEMFLTPGDAVALEASALEHYTTPLLATNDEPDPRRIVLVGRYFLG